jgi:hypothetical protein
MSVDTNASAISAKGIRHRSDTTGGDDGYMAKSILDPSFRYRPSHDTDIRKTFERVREELARKSAARRPSNVSPLLQKEKS